MNLINKEVIHKSFGKGSVVNQSDSRIEINFRSGNKKFLFPDAFGKFLTLTDPNVAKSIKKIVQKKQVLQKQKEDMIEKERERQREEQKRLLERQRFMENFKAHPCSQAVFWCKEDYNEVFSEWKVFTGIAKSGTRAGQPNRPIRINKNSACLLTERNHNVLEKDRRIVGVFMVNESFIGKMCEDGNVTSHSEYRLQLSKEESDKMLFWNYYINEKYPKNMTWNSGKYRYFNNLWMAQILKDIVSLKQGQKEQKLAQAFFEHYCELNGIDNNEIPKPMGALHSI